MSPTHSDDLTHVIEERNGEYVVLLSPETAEDDPEYCEVRLFPTRQEAIISLGLRKKRAEI